MTKREIPIVPKPTAPRTLRSKLRRYAYLFAEILAGIGLPGLTIYGLVVWYLHDHLLFGSAVATCVVTVVFAATIFHGMATGGQAPLIAIPLMLVVLSCSGKPMIFDIDFEILAAAFVIVSVSVLIGTHIAEVLEKRSATPQLYQDG